MLSVRTWRFLATPIKAVLDGLERRQKLLIGPLMHAMTLRPTIEVFPVACAAHKR